MLKYIIISCFTVLISANGNTVNEINKLNPEQITETLFNQMDEQGALDNLTPSQELDVKNALQTEVKLRFARVATGELSLDPSAPNYFLLDTIKAGLDAVKNIAQNIVSGVINIGKKVFNTVKGVLGPVVNVGIAFLQKIDNPFIKGVIGTAVDALGTALSKFGPLIGDAISFIPIVGPIISTVMDVLLPWADKVLNYDNVELAVKALKTAGDALGFTRDVIQAAAEKDPAEAALAPGADRMFAHNLDAISKKGDASKEDKEKLGTAYAKGCHNLMKFLKTLDADKYNKLSQTAKEAAMQCNHLATVINLHAASK